VPTNGMIFTPSSVKMWQLVQKLLRRKGYRRRHTHGRHDPINVTFLLKREKLAKDGKCHVKCRCYVASHNIW
jgi:hypothetical protein